MGATSLPASTLRFAVLGELGTGGMARVELARLIDGDGRLVAVKRPHAYLAKEREFVQMFLDEAWVTGMIQHPNVAGLVGWGWDAEGIFLATEFVAGVSLASLMKRISGKHEPVTQELVAYVGAQVASGLSAAHALHDERGRPRGFIHRDISPGNILLGFDGSVKIADFGIAKGLASRGHTATGILKGKVAYMAPEYAQGNDCDGRADLFSLGAVLYELLSGRRPLEGKNELDTVRLLLTADPTPLASRCNVDPDLARAIDRLLARDPNVRPRSGEEVEEELDAWLTRRSFEPSLLRRQLGEKVETCGATRRRALRRMQSDVTEVSRTGPRSNVTGAAILTVHTRRTPVGAPEPFDQPARETRRVVLDGEPPGVFAASEKVGQRVRHRWTVLAGVAAIVVPSLVLAMVRRPSAAPASATASAPSPPSAQPVEEKTAVAEPLGETSLEPSPSIPDVSTSTNPPVAVKGSHKRLSKPLPSTTPPPPALPKRGSCNPHEFDYYNGRCAPAP